MCDTLSYLNAQLDHLLLVAELLTECLLHLVLQNRLPVLQLSDGAAKLLALLLKLLYLLQTRIVELMGRLL